MRETFEKVARTTDKSVKTGGSKVMKLLKTLRMTALGLGLLAGSAHLAVAADEAGDAKIKEEMTKYSEENEKIREAHIQELRELHLKHVNEMYDRRLANNKELGVMWREIKPGDTAASKELRAQIKEKQKAFHEEEKKFRKEFQENVLKPKNMAFRDSMKGRGKEKRRHHRD